MPSLPGSVFQFACFRGIVEKPAIIFGLYPVYSLGMQYDVMKPITRHSFSEFYRELTSPHCMHAAALPISEYRPAHGMAKKCLSYHRRSQGRMQGMTAGENGRPLPEIKIYITKSITSQATLLANAGFYHGLTLYITTI